MMIIPTTGCWHYVLNERTKLFVRTFGKKPAMFAVCIASKKYVGWLVERLESLNDPR